MGDDLYAVLGVGENANEDEIKRAYFRQVRKYPPEKSPDEFRKIRSAYETLSNPKLRQDYGSRRRFGKKIDELLAEVARHAESEEWGSCISLLKQVLELNPTLDSARNQLGLFCVREEDYSSAIDAFRMLTEQNPDNHDYWENLGFAWLKKGQSLSSDSISSGCYDVARKAYERAIALNKTSYDAHLALSEISVRKGDFSEALAFAERAVGVDGKTDVQDFDALLQVARIHGLRGHFETMRRTVSDSIMPLVGGNPNLREKGANFFANNSVELFQKERSEAALRFVEMAREFKRDDYQINRLYEALHERARSPTGTIGTTPAPTSAPSSESNEGSGCAPIAGMLIGAAIGAIGHVPGMIIGGWIGYNIGKSIGK